MFMSRDSVSIAKISLRPRTLWSLTSLVPNPFLLLYSGVEAVLYSTLMKPRSYFRKLLLVLLVLLVGSVGLILLNAPPDEQLAEVPPALDAEADISVSRFDYTQLQDGTTAWRLQAERGGVTLESGISSLQDVRLKVFDVEPFGPVEASAEAGTWDRKAGDIQLQGNVMVRTEQGMSLASEELSWHSKDQTVRSTRPVVLLSPQWSVRGDALLADLEHRSMTITGHVRARWYSAMSGGKG